MDSKLSNIEKAEDKNNSISRFESFFNYFMFIFWLIPFVFYTSARIYFGTLEWRYILKTLFVSLSFFSCPLLFYLKISKKYRHLVASESKSLNIMIVIVTVIVLIGMLL